MPFFYSREIDKHMLDVYELVAKEVNICLKEHGFTELSSSQCTMLREQIIHITDKDNTIHKLISK